MGEHGASWEVSHVNHRDYYRSCGSNDAALDKSGNVVKAIVNKDFAAYPNYIVASIEEV